MSKVILINHCTDCPYRRHGSVEYRDTYGEFETFVISPTCDKTNGKAVTYEIPDWCPLEDMKGGE